MSTVSKSVELGSPTDSLRLVELVLARGGWVSYDSPCDRATTIDWAGGLASKPKIELTRLGLASNEGTRSCWWLWGGSSPATVRQWYFASSIWR